MPSSGGPAVSVAMAPPPGSNGTDDTSSRRQTYTIYRAPPGMREVDPENYEPQLVSIGPYHHGSRSLQVMQKLKVRYQEAFVQRCSANRSLTAEQWLSEVRGLEDRARECYWDDTSDLDSDQFSGMLLLDGCFILELLLKLKKDSQTPPRQHENDPVFSTKWMLSIVMRDLLLLDNQLPLFVLQHLFDKLPASNTTLATLCLSFCIKVSQLAHIHEPREYSTVNQEATAHHLLHLYHALHPTTPQLEALKQVNLRGGDLMSALAEIKFPNISTYSVTDLGFGSVKFKAMKQASSFIDLRLKRRVVSIPRLSVNPLSISLLRNLIALEECLPNVGSHFSTYAMFMGSLVARGEDARLLEAHGIVQRGLHSDDEVVRVFSRLCKGFVDADYYDSNNIPLYKYLHMETRRPRLNIFITSLFSFPFTMLLVKLYATVFTLIVGYAQLSQSGGGQVEQGVAMAPLANH